MLQTSVRLYKNAYSGLSRPMWWLALVMLVNRSGTMVIPFLTVYLKSMGYSLQEAGFVMAAFGSGAILGGFLGGIFTDRIGHYPVQFCSLLLNGVLFFVLGQMHSLGSIIACIFVLSTLGEAFRPANSAAIAAYSNESNRIRCYSLNRLAVNLGWAIGPAIGGLLASINYSLLFWVDGVTCILAALLLLVVLSPSKIKQVKQKSPEENAGVTAYRDKHFLFGMFFIFLIGICFFQMFSILPVYYKDSLKFNEKTIGALLAMNGIIITVVEMVLVYKLEPRGNGVLYMMTGAFLIAISFLMLDIAPLLVVAVASMIVITFGEMLLFPFMNNFWVKRSREFNRGQYAAVYTMSFSAAIVMAPTFASQIASRLGFTTLWLINFFVCCCAGLGFLWLKKRVAYE